MNRALDPLDDERRHDARSTVEHVDAVEALVTTVVENARRRFEAATGDGIGDDTQAIEAGAEIRRSTTRVEGVRCERCGRERRPWPLKRGDTCSPKWWKVCIRAVEIGR